jgi:drug/metabolite transporter (DMT)-like permease
MTFDQRDPSAATRQNDFAPNQSRAEPRRVLITARLMIVAAAVLWSTSGFFAKLPLFEDWPPESRGVQLAFWRALFAGLLILPAVRRRSFRAAMIPMAFSFAAMNVLYLTSVSLTTAANAIWLQSTAPWWVFLIGVYAMREPISRSDLIPLACGFAGVALILAHELQNEIQWGVVFGLISAFGYAGVVLFLRKLRGEDSAWLVAVNHLVTATLLLPFVLYYRHWPSGVQLLVLAAFGFFQMALPYLLFGWALRHITGTEATAIGLLEPTLVPLWAYLARREEPAWWTIVGAAIILAGLLLRYVVVRERAPPAPSQNA